MPFPTHSGGRRLYCTDQRIHAELRRLVTGRTTFPSRRELNELGLGGLINAASRHRGLNAWADLMNLPRARPVPLTRRV